MECRPCDIRDNLSDLTAANQAELLARELKADRLRQPKRLEFSRLQATVEELHLARHREHEADGQFSNRLGIAALRALDRDPVRLRRSALPG